MYADGLVESRTAHPDLTETARLIEDGRYEAANGLLRLALLQSLSAEESTEAFLQLARLHARRGDSGRARRFLDRVLLEYPEHPARDAVLAEIAASRGPPAARGGLWIGIVLLGTAIAAGVVWGW